MTTLREISIGPWVAAGGAVGAVARYVGGNWVATFAPMGFPWATIAVNIVGSVVLGFVIGALPAPAASPQLRGFLAIGLCGGFTTFSAFDLEMLTLLRDSRIAAAALYSSGSVAFCIGAVAMGWWLGATSRGRTGPG